MEIKADVLTGVGVNKPKKRANSTTPESRVLAALKTWAKDKPDVYVVRVVQAGENGVPDFVLCIRGRFVGVECKAAGEKPRSLQYRHGERITDALGEFMWGDADVLIPKLETLYANGRKKRAR